MGQLRLDQLQLHYNYVTFSQLQLQLHYNYSLITVAQLQLQNQQLQIYNYNNFIIVLLAIQNS
jgi:hypothetical protein